MVDLPTNTLLLDALRHNEDAVAWRLFTERYLPIIERFARRLGVRRDETADVAQNAMLAFLRSFRSGRYERNRGRLRQWLLGIARHEIARVRRSRHHAEREPASFDQCGLEPAAPNMHDAWDREWSHEVLRAALRRVRAEVDHRTFDAFERTSLRDEPIAAVAADLGMTCNAVYGARRRVLDRLRDIESELAATW